MTRHLIAALLLAASESVHAVDLNVIGLFPGKAVVVVNRGAPRTLSVGQKAAEGVQLVAVDALGATFEIEGKRTTIAMGQHFETPSLTGTRNSVILAPDSRGHFMIEAQVNGVPVRMLLDTGATFVAIPAAEARRLGIDYAKAPRGYSQTANGLTPVYRVKLETLTIGEITVHGIEAMVLEGGGLDVALLGMSFLNRMEMRREGTTLTLTKRF